MNNDAILSFGDNDYTLKGAVLIEGPKLDFDGNGLFPKSDFNCSMQFAPTNVTPEAAEFLNDVYIQCLADARKKYGQNQQRRGFYYLPPFDRR